MDDFEKCGLYPTPAQREAFARAAAALNVTMRDVIGMFAELRVSGDLSALGLASFGLNAADVPAKLPKTSSKGHWRDVVPRNAR